MAMQNVQEELKEALRRACNELADGYMVPDIVPTTASFVFLLESPHVQELKYGAPVSGSSGASMSRHLFGEAYGHLPLGIIVKKNRDEQLHRPSLDKVGLMNVCNIPMQGSAYGNPDVVRKYADLLRALETLRTAGQSTSYKDPALALTQDILLENLRKRLRKLWDRSLFLVPCGRFAQKFFALADLVSPQWQVVTGIPHPSYNNWSKPQYAGAVSRLVSLFQNES
ncbi:hypothetical protein GCM10025857_12400 [Alicyclobacillus contaminans]|nr:hypothetical protein GCM10025857_12400 [Alicyclobacillus contaminans]